MVFLTSFAMPLSSKTPLRLIQTGQRSCHDADGREIGCDRRGQDGEFSAGVTWPTPGFLQQDERLTDSLTHGSDMDPLGKTCRIPARLAGIAG
jgi:hypothetical protein